MLDLGVQIICFPGNMPVHCKVPLLSIKFSDTQLCTQVELYTQGWYVSVLPKNTALWPTTKPWFENANCQFNHEQIPKAAKMK